MKKLMYAVIVGLLLCGCSSIHYADGSIAFFTKDFTEFGEYAGKQYEVIAPLRIEKLLKGQGAYYLTDPGMPAKGKTELFMDIPVGTIMTVEYVAHHQDFWAPIKSTLIAKIAHPTSFVDEVDLFYLMKWKPRERGQRGAIDFAERFIGMDERFLKALP
ncbi:hypothetical protein ACFL1E_03530 [Candidatus Omnitrophota bacterium]